MENIGKYQFQEKIQHPYKKQGCYTCPLALAPKGLMPTLAVQGTQEPEGRKQRSCNKRRANQVPVCGLLFLEACLGMRELGEIWESSRVQI